MNLGSGFIQWSSSAATVPILFAKMKVRGLWLSVDYRAFNLGIVKNRYPFPLTLELLDRVREAGIFTKLDLGNAFHPIRIKEGDKFKPAFRTHYGQSEYYVMPFSLTNAQTIFQAYIDDCLLPYIADFTMYYLDDLLIYCTN
jgi:hypothetical protein